MKKEDRLKKNFKEKGKKKWMSRKNGNEEGKKESDNKEIKIK